MILPLFLWTLILVAPFVVVGTLALVAFAPEVDWRRVWDSLTAVLVPSFGPPLRVPTRWGVPA